MLPAAFDALAAVRQFVTWIAVPSRDRPGKIDKFPTDATGRVVSAHDPLIWRDAVTAASQGNAGFVFTHDDPFFFLDIDGCWTPPHENTLGFWSPLAHELCARFVGAAIEVSHSGTGLHIIGRYTGSPPPHGTKNVALGLELYTSGRFVALTGAEASGSAGHDCTDALAWLAATYFPPTAVATHEQGWTHEPVTEWAGPTDDVELVRLARTAGDRSPGATFDPLAVTFGRLWDADADALGAKWPSSTGQPWNASSAEQALANHLAFWTGKDCDRMERLMRASALRRDKWDSHRTYLERTILAACAYVSKVATGRAVAVRVAAAVEPEATGQRDPAQEWMGPHDQLQHFQGCYYLSKQSKIYVASRNEVVSKSTFDVVFGGHLFTTDAMGTAQGKTTSAYEAFTQSRVNICPVVTDICFRPSLPSGALVREAESIYVNSYLAYDCPAQAGDVAPYLDLLERQLPNRVDRDLLLHYMASLVQNIGVKFQWWPVLQGAEGNGKTFHIRVLTHILSRKYVHLPNVQGIARKGMNFNGWVQRKLFLGMEEIAISHNRDFLEEMKPLITNDMMEIERKGVDQDLTDNYANGCFCTNHEGALPADTRRYGIFHMAQQTPADLERDGMSGAYFPDLYDWFAGRRGHAVAGAEYVAHYLKRYPLQAEMDPAQLLIRAPRTSSFERAMEVSRTTIQQEVMEAAESGRYGFAGGWVSTAALDKLLDAQRYALSRTKRRPMLEDLGYVQHPHLTGGRTTEVMPGEGVKPRLYLTAGHLALQLTSPAAIQKAYVDAQARAGSDEAAAVFSSAK